MFEIRAGDLLINRIWAQKGSAGIVPSPLSGCVVTQDFPVWELDQGLAYPEYIGFYLRTEAFWNRCLEHSHGTSGRERLRMEELPEILFPLPPLDEQRRVTTLLEEIATKVTEALKLTSEGSDLTDALIASEETHLWSALVGIPVRRLDEVTSFLSRGRQSKQGESEHFLIKTQHVQMGRCLPTSLTLAEDVAARVKSDAQVRPGDVLIACSAAGCLGRVAQYTDSRKVASTDTHVAIARPDSTVVDPDYLYGYLRSAPGQFQLRSRERGDWEREKVGFRLTELNLNDLRAVPVPLPSFREQKRLVGLLDALHSQTTVLKNLQAESAAQLAALIPSTLDKALNGHL